jgi:hypothetical protein
MNMGQDPDQKLIFVYNADSGFINMMEDYLHKEVKPSTYECNLCALTYGAFGMKKDWVNFIGELGYTVEFLHRDEFVETYNIEKAGEFPAVFIKIGSHIHPIITSAEINELNSLDELIGLVNKKINELKSD